MSLDRFIEDYNADVSFSSKDETKRATIYLPKTGDIAGILHKILAQYMIVLWFVGSYEQEGNVAFDFIEV